MMLFDEQVINALGGYMESLGFSLSSQGDGCVVFGSDLKVVIIRLCQDRGFYEVDGEVRLKKNPFGSARFSEISRVHNRCFSMPFVASDLEEVEKGVGAICSFIKSELKDVLQSLDGEFEMLLASVTELRQKETNHYAFSPIRKIANQAWEVKDFTRVVEAYGGMEGALNESEKRRLMYAKTKI